MKLKDIKDNIEGKIDRLAVLRKYIFFADFAVRFADFDIAENGEHKEADVEYNENGKSPAFKRYIFVAVDGGQFMKIFLGF